MRQAPGKVSTHRSQNHVMLCADGNLLILQGCYEEACPKRGHPKRSVCSYATLSNCLEERDPKKALFRTTPRQSITVSYANDTNMDHPSSILDSSLAANALQEGLEIVAL